MAVVGVVLVLAFPSALRLDLDNAESLDDATSGRYELMRGGVELAGDRPLLGLGLGRRSPRIPASTASGRARTRSRPRTRSRSRSRPSRA